MTTVRRKAKRRYIGAPWLRGAGSQKDTKMERTKQSKATNVDTKRPFRLPLVIKPNGCWGYKFGKLRQAIKKKRL